jgi:hypothetical protein
VDERERYRLKYLAGLVGFVQRYSSGQGEREGLVTSRHTGVETLAEMMLTDAYEFVLSGWCQGSSALDECGRPIEPASAFARRWSVLGALERAWRRSPEPAVVAHEAFESARLALTAAVNDVPQFWNDLDGRRQSEVLDALAEAVQLVTVAEPQRPDLVAALVEDVDDVPLRRASDTEASVSVPAETPRTA